ncbi:MAG: class I SAM-dependent methyltransferase [Burkholderiales bacterium]|nr:class I SAM-dependent methyltransferase [Burkholderiales bacterium]
MIRACSRFAQPQRAAPSPWIARFAHLVAPGARVLDLAAGGGRHARFFAARGARVLAVDRDAAALASCAEVDGIETHVADLETGAWPLAGETFDAIVVTNYLHRPLFAALRTALTAAGVLLYETFAQGNERYGRPANPDFLLDPGELLALAARPPALTVVAFEQGAVVTDPGCRIVQRIAAVGPGYPWPPASTEAATAAAGNGGRRAGSNARRGALPVSGRASPHEPME